MLDGFFEIYFKSVNYKEPIQKSEVQIKQDDLDPQQNPEQSSQQTEDQQQQQQQDQQQIQSQQKQDLYQKPEITQHDLDMVEAKKKINLIFKQPQVQLDNVTAIVNLFVPYFEEEQPQDQNQELQQQSEVVQQEQTIQPVVEPSKPVGKWDFDPKTIDIYDGEQPLIQEGVRQIVDSIFQYQFQELVIVNDERAIEFARLQIYNFLKEKLESFMNVPDFSNLQFHKVKYNQANVPIFDFEL